MFSALALAATATALFGVVDQDENRAPAPWRALTAQEASAFDLGHAVFNTQWSVANEPASRRDGLGPLFNGPSCDGCHNSRRRGRGPNDSGAAPSELVMQLGTRAADGTITRGTERFGFIVNTAANGGLKPEASVTIRYEEFPHVLADGRRLSLRRPTYDVTPTSGGALSATTVLMPRMAQAVQGVGLLERVSRVDGKTITGRFGWQATEPTVASQVAAAFSREMGLTSPLIPHIDCECDGAPSGGTPEVEPQLFEAVVRFMEFHAVPRSSVGGGEPTSALFAGAGCADCHRQELRLDAVPGDEQERVIHPYTDLMLHDLGEGLADRDAAGNAVPSTWRTAPLWGLNATVAVGRPLRLLHDGRARSIEEAIAWHGGEARESRLRFERLPKADRDAVVAWIASR